MEKVSEVYRHLYHYTNWDGLKGILDTQSMWASNIRYLNDQSELFQARDAIHRLLLPRVTSVIEEMASTSTQAKKFVEIKGGSKKFADNETRTLIKAAYHATGEDFYVLSFCGEPKKQYIKENGLLSQWRGYGAGGGFAIVLDSKKMELLFENEIQNYDYGPSHISDAIYGEDDKNFETEFIPRINDFVDYSAGMIRHIIFGDNMPDPSKAMDAMFVCITRYKHIGFEEEDEVRIVAAPTIQTQEYIDLHREKKKILKSPKQINVRTENGKPTPYIELFDFHDRKLPIEKIIVGPSADKEMIAAAVRKFVIGTKIEVTVSDIPYV